MRYTDTAVESIRIETSPREADFWATHRHQRHELLSAVSVGLTVATDHAVHAVPRGSGIWIPAEAAHAVRAHPGNTMRCTWFDAHVIPDALLHVTPLSSSPLLDAVLAHLDDVADASRRARAEAFALDLLSGGARPEAGLPQPSTPWLREITTALIGDPASARTTAEWARTASVSVRTLARRFQVETGMSFSQWRTRLRIRVAMSDLIAGASVASTARRTGYDSAAAFTTAFRRATGTTPRAYVRGAEIRPPADM